MLLWPSLHELLESRRSRRVVTVSGVVSLIDPDAQDVSGVKHQIFLMEVRDVLGESGDAPQVGEVLLVSVRYGDAAGLDEPIPNLEAEAPIAVRGDYITPEEARATDDGERLGVLHFTHRPLGWVRYRGRLYR